MKLITHDVGDDYEHFGVHSQRTHRSVYVVNDNGREIARFSIRNLNRPISEYPEEIEMAKRFITAETAAAYIRDLEMIMSIGDAHMKTLIAERDEARAKLEQAVAAEREACAKVAESGRYIHGMMSGEIAYSRQTARDIAAAIRAR